MPPACETWMPCLGVEPESQKLRPMAYGARISHTSVRPGTKTAALPDLAKARVPGVSAIALAVPIPEPVRGVVSPRVAGKRITRGSEAGPGLPRLGFGVVLALEATQVIFAPRARVGGIEKPKRFSLLEMLMVEDTLLGIAHPFDNLEVAINEPQIEYPIVIWPVPAAELEIAVAGAGAERKRLGMRPRPPLLWVAAAAIPNPGRFDVQPFFECLEVAEVETPAPTAAAAEVVALPAARRFRGLIVGPVGKVIAASLIFCATWAITSKLGLSRRNAASRQNGTPESSVAAVAPSVTAKAISGATTSKSEGTLAKMRKAIADRASFQTGDNFKHGMQSWETRPGSDAPNWERSAEGYVRPGSLALFRPSAKLTDYRLEFSGQVEKKGLGWAVRAQDPQNYYAMKVKVLQTGPRPVIAIVHYAVIDGKVGHRVETPLNLMVHNNTPMAVAVTVKGSHLSVSIDGEEVDSWSDEVLPAGGVGFFADAGDKAQLYWMKITGNDDWLGHFCSMLAVSENDAPVPTASVIRRETNPAMVRPRVFGVAA